MSGVFVALLAIVLGLLAVAWRFPIRPPVENLDDWVKRPSEVEADDGDLHFWANVLMVVVMCGFLVFFAVTW